MVAHCTQQLACSSNNFRTKSSVNCRLKGRFTRFGRITREARLAVAFANSASLAHGKAPAVEDSRQGAGPKPKEEGEPQEEEGLNLRVLGSEAFTGHWGHVLPDGSWHGARSLAGFARACGQS